MRPKYFVIFCKVLGAGGFIWLYRMTEGRCCIPRGVPPICHPARIAWYLVIQAETAARPFSTDATKPTALTDNVRDTYEIHKTCIYGLPAHCRAGACGQRIFPVLSHKRSGCVLPLQRQCQ